MVVVCVFNVEKEYSLSGPDREELWNWMYNIVTFIETPIPDWTGCMKV